MMGLHQALLDRFCRKTGSPPDMQYHYVVKAVWGWNGQLICAVVDVNHGKTNELPFLDLEFDTHG